MANNTRRVLGSRPARTTKSARTFRDPWLTYLVAQTDGEITTEVVKAFQSIDEMVKRGVEMTEVLADYILSTTSSGRVGRPIPVPNESLRREYVERVQGALNGKPDDPRASIYFIRWGDMVKIGTSVDVATRVRSLSLPPESVVATEPGGYKREAYLHARFADYRVKSTEWFRQHRELDDYIASVSGVSL